MSTRDLVDALISGDSLAIENSFSNVMSAKVSSALDDYRIQVAQSMFAAPEESAEDNSTEE